MVVELSGAALWDKLVRAMPKLKLLSFGDAYSVKGAGAALLTTASGYPLRCVEAAFTNASNVES